MSQPKRHHWWPQVQSRYWTDTDGLVNVTRQNGSVFRANPNNIAVESELYTRFSAEQEKDTSIEDWFSTKIDGPAKTMIEYLLDPENRRRRIFKGEAVRAKAAKEVGFRVRDYVEFIILRPEIRQAIAHYLSALLVRHPNYLAKLVHFHKLEGGLGSIARNNALDNMLHIYNIYLPIMQKSVFMVCRRDSDAEFIYSDGGVVVEEPWRENYGIPFDMHAPLTPDISLEVLPMPLPSADLSIAHVSDMTTQGVGRMNRIILGSATRFVFTRQKPPTQFISKHFGVPAPKNIGYRIVNGELETRYERSRV